MRVVTEVRARHLVLGLVAALAGVALLVTAIGRLAGFADVRDTLSGADPLWLLGCACGQVLVFVGYAGVLRTAIAVDGGREISASLSVRLALASFATTQLFSFAGVAGLAIVYWALRRLGRERDDAAVVLIGLNTCVYFVFGVIGWSAAAVALWADQVPAGMAIPWLVGIPVVLAAAAWFTAPSRVDRWVRPTTSRLRRALGTGVAAARWARLRIGGRGGRTVLWWAALYWIGDVFSLSVAVRAFGGSFEPAALVAAYASGYLVQSLPLPFIAGTGVDAATTFLLHAIGVPLEVALVAVVAHRVFAFWLPIVPGCVLAVTLPRSLPLAAVAVN